MTKPDSHRVQKNAAFSPCYMRLRKNPWEHRRSTLPFPIRAEMVFFAGCINFTKNTKQSATFTFLDSSAEPLSQTNLYSQPWNIYSSKSCVSMNRNHTIKCRGGKGATNNGSNAWYGFRTIENINFTVIQRQTFPGTKCHLYFFFFCKVVTTKGKLLLLIPNLRMEASTKLPFLHSSGRNQASAWHCQAAQQSPAWTWSQSNRGTPSPAVASSL